MTQLLKRWLRRGLILLTPAALAACTTTPQPPRVVKVPVPVDCEIEQVARSERPKADASMGLFDLAKVALANLRIVEAENERLRAANANPCPAPK